MRVKDILNKKGTDVATIDPGATIAAAVALLHRHRIGALVVSTDGATISGILSERDVVAALATMGADLLTGTVRQIMTSEVLTCEPGDELRTLAITMTEKRFRHMPVTVGGRLAGIVSIGDVVKHRLKEIEQESAALRDYIQTA